MADNGAVFIDTNIVLRWNIAEAPLHDEIRTAVELLVNAGRPLWVSVQVLREFASVLTRPQTFATLLPAATVADRIQALIPRLHVAEETLAVHSKLLELMKAHPMGGKQVHDANIVASMLAYGVPTIFTLNPGDFARFSSRIEILTVDALLEPDPPPS